MSAGDGSAPSNPFPLHSEGDRRELDLMAPLSRITSRRSLPRRRLVIQLVRSPAAFMIGDKEDQPDSQKHYGRLSHQHVSLCDAWMGAPRQDCSCDRYAENSTRLPKHSTQSGDLGNPVRRQLKRSIVGCRRCNAHAQTGNTGTHREPYIR